MKALCKHTALHKCIILFYLLCSYIPAGAQNFLPELFYLSLPLNYRYSRVGTLVYKAAIHVIHTLMVFLAPVVLYRKQLPHSS